MKPQVARVTMGTGMLLVACSASTPREPRADGAVDLAIAPIASLKAPKIATTDAGGGGGDVGTCVLRLQAGHIRMTNPTCYLDTEINRGLGTLRYACSGDGEAEAQFGKQQYEGRIDRGAVTLTFTSELDWNDGCRWGTRATITGTIAKGRAPRLTWDYLDHVISGQGCSGICRASTTMRDPSERDEDGDTD
jgi:hypothetical protein